jgi:hypothetical protein
VIGGWLPLFCRRHLSSVCCRSKPASQMASRMRCG